MKNVSPVSGEISVAVQGPIVGSAPDGMTAQCLRSIRRFLPDAEIILSTYKNSDVTGLTFDVLIENDDPGTVPCTVAEPYFYTNINRQIATARAALRAVQRPYALKLRSDLLLEGDGMLSYFNRFPVRSEKWRVFTDRVLCCTRYARNPRRHLPYAFHPSDWFFFGRTNDVLSLYDIPFEPEPEFSRYFETHPRPVPDVVPGALFRYAPEQHFWLSCMKKRAPDDWAKSERNLPEYLTDIRGDIIVESEQSIANNFVLLGERQAQIRFAKYPVTPDDWVSLYSHAEWLRLYETYCLTPAGKKLPFSLPDKESMEHWLMVRRFNARHASGKQRVLALLRRTLPRRTYRWMGEIYKRLQH